MRIHLLFFASAYDLAGVREATAELAAGARTGAVRTHLKSLDPRFADWGDRMRFAVNREYVLEDQVLHDGDEVAVIPPVSGG